MDGNVTFGGYGTPKFFSRGDWLNKTLPLLYERGLCFFTFFIVSSSAIKTINFTIIEGE